MVYVPQFLMCIYASSLVFINLFFSPKQRLKWLLLRTVNSVWLNVCQHLGVPKCRRQPRLKQSLLQAHLDSQTIKQESSTCAWMAFSSHHYAFLFGSVEPTRCFQTAPDTGSHYAHRVELGLRVFPAASPLHLFPKGCVNPTELWTHLVKPTSLLLRACSCWLPVFTVTV